MRTRRAHFRASDLNGQTWKLTWCPQTGELYGRPLHARTNYSLSGAVLIEALRNGSQTGAAPRDDPRQLRFA